MLIVSMSFLTLSRFSLCASEKKEPVSSASCQAGSTFKTSTIKLIQRRRNKTLNLTNRVSEERCDWELLNGDDVRVCRSLPVAGVGRLQPGVCQGPQLAGLPAATPRAPRGGRHGGGAGAARGSCAGRVAVEQRQRRELPHRLPKPAHSSLLRIVLGGGGHVRVVRQNQNPAKGEMAGWVNRDLQVLKSGD